MPREARHTKVSVRAGTELPLVVARGKRRLGRVVQQAHDADGVVGHELVEDVVAVRQPLGQDLEHAHRQVQDRGVVSLGGQPEVAVGQRGREHVLAQQLRVRFHLVRLEGEVLADVEALLLAVLARRVPLVSPVDLRPGFSFVSFSSSSFVSLPLLGMPLTQVYKTQNTDTDRYTHTNMARFGCLLSPLSGRAGCSPAASGSR